MKIPSIPISRWKRTLSDDVYRDDGYVGIGTSAPDTELDVVGSAEISEDLTVGGDIINAALDQSLEDIISGLDGYALATIENQRWADSSQQRQDLRDAADGYADEAIVSGLEEDIQVITSSLDGYALTTTEDQRWIDSSEQRQDLRDAADGYASEVSVSELDAELQTVISDLDGYALVVIEDQRWADSSQQRQDLRDAADGYAGGTVTSTEGADGYLAFFTGPDAIAGDNDLFWDRANNRLGLGTSNPFNRLDIASGVAIGSAYAGVETAPTDGLLVEGTVGIGTASPSATVALDVVGKISASDEILVPIGTRIIFGTTTADGWIYSSAPNSLVVGAGGTSGTLAINSSRIQIPNSRRFDLTGNGRLWNNGAPVQIGGATTTSHSLTTSATMFGFDTNGVSAEFNGKVFCDAALDVAGDALFDGYVQQNSGMSINRTATATDLYLDGAQHLVAVTDTTSPRTVYLPDATDLNAGHVFVVKDESGAAGGNNITVAPADGAQTIDGAASVAISANYGAVQIYTDGADWFTM